MSDSTNEHNMCSGRGDAQPGDWASWRGIQAEEHQTRRLTWGIIFYHPWDEYCVMNHDTRNKGSPILSPPGRRRGSKRGGEMEVGYYLWGLANPFPACLIFSGTLIQWVWGPGTRWTDNLRCRWRSFWNWRAKTYPLHHDHLCQIKRMVVFIGESFWGNLRTQYANQTTFSHRETCCLSGAWDITRKLSSLVQPSVYYLLFFMSTAMR